MFLMFPCSFLQSEGSQCISLKAMGRAINKAVTIAEVLKRKMPLHQVTTLSSCEMIDVFEPLEEGLDIVTSRRFVSCMKITLSRDGSGIDINDIGYQPPLPMIEIHPGDTNPQQHHYHHHHHDALSHSSHQGSSSHPYSPSFT
jgi:DNA-binding protein